MTEKTSVCSIPDCPRGGKLSRGMCATHYARWQRRGDPYAADGRKNRPKIEAKCSVEDCDRPALKKTFCGAHYKRSLRHGDPLGGVPTVHSNGACAVASCRRPSKFQGLCKFHYERQLQTGDPLKRRPRALRPVKRYRTVGAADHPLVRSDGKVATHRRILFDAIGPGPHPCHWCGTPVVWATGQEAIRNLVVDHLDHDKLNNDLANLVPTCNACNGHRVQGSEWTAWCPGNPVGVIDRTRRSCRNGHELTSGSVYVSPAGRRRCHQCIRDWTREYTERKRALR